MQASATGIIGAKPAADDASIKEAAAPDFNDAAAIIPAVIKAAAVTAAKHFNKKL